MKWVLVIEHSEADRAYLERIISRLGYQLYSAMSGAQALYYMNQSLPSAIIVGEHLPDYDPLVLGRHIKEDIVLSNPPMLLMTSNNDPQFKNEAQQAGFADTVKRPMSIRSFFTKLELCLSNNRRLCIRAPMELPVTLTHGSREYSFKTHNFGERGMYIPTTDPFPRKTSVGLQFNLPGLRTLFNFKGEIVHTLDRDSDDVPAGMGLKFLDISPAIDAVLGIYMENFLAKRLPVAL
jgi:twitching motility two-component system response regulator PilH